MEARIDELLSKLTLEEKVSLCAGVDFWHTQSIGRLGIRTLKMTDGPHGCRTVDDSGQTIPGNCYPTGSALAATWDTELISRVGMAIGEEAGEKGCALLLGPCVNIQRSPLAGRNFESYSEDPYLAARMAVAFINGIQSKGVGTCVKHYALNNSEYQRFTISSEATERAIREIYLPAFEAAIREAKSWTLMSSYNKVNGIYASENHYLLTDVLKKEWGFDGAVISDWGGTYSTIPAANAGLDMEMPGPARFFGDRLLKAVREGAVTEETVNDKVRRILRVIERAGLLEKTRTAITTPSEKPERRALARETAAEAIVLLKNREQVLPLMRQRIKSIAIIGHNALEARIEGAGSSQVRPYYAITPLEAVKRECGRSVRVVFEMGYRNNRFTPSLRADDLRLPGNEQGLMGEYFTSEDLSGKPFQVRVEKSLSFRFTRAGSSPGLDIVRDTRSARWSGKFIAQETGLYTFGLLTDGLARISIGGRTIIESPGREAAPPDGLSLTNQKRGTFRMTAGESYDMVVEYRVIPNQRSILRRLRVGCEPPAPSDMVERAIKAAAGADLALVFAGTNEEWDSEGFDRENMELPGGQAELIERIADVNKKTIVVLNNGAPVEMDRWAGKVAGIIEAWFPGQECGNAIADVLFGKVNPSGKLPVTFPVRLEDNPAFINYPGENGRVLYGEGIFVGYRYYDKKKIAPLFPFGFGLSYASFKYSNMRTGRMTARGTVGVSLDITNTGRQSGKEVVQLYVRDVVSSLMRPPQELKGFRKVALKPGETRKVEFLLDNRSFSFYDAEKKDWVLEPGEFEILIGSSSRDIRASHRINIK